MDRKRPLLRPWPWLLAALLSPLTTQAAPPEGRLLASNCFQCHGTSGKGPGFERLAGMPATEILDELREMRSGQEGDSLMSRHAKGYTDAQLQAIACWLSRQR
jgi:cytochrome c553